MRALSITDTDPFLVTALLRDGSRLRITAGSALAAAAAAEYWRDHQPDAGEVQWCLRDDLAYPEPMLLFTRHPAAEVMHATELVPGKAISEHPATLCGLSLQAMWVCTPQLASPCTGCLLGVRLVVPVDRGPEGVL